MVDYRDNSWIRSTYRWRPDNSPTFSMVELRYHLSNLEEVPLAGNKRIGPLE